MASMTSIQHVHELDTWAVYPRLQYFQRRFIDLQMRFSKTAEAFPKSFHNKNVIDELSKLCTTLKNLPRVLVFGDDIPIEYGIGPQDSESNIEDRLEAKIFSLKDLQLENWKQYQKSFETKADEGEERTCLDIIVVGACCTRMTDEEKHSAETIKLWLIKAGVEVPILVNPELTKLSDDIEKVLETHIMEGFENMFTYLQQYFIRKNTNCNIVPIEDILDEETVFIALTDTLHDKDLPERRKEISGTDEHLFSEILAMVCQRIQCSIVPTLAATYNILEFLCYQLLNELHFKELLFKVVAEDPTIYRRIICHEASTKFKIKKGACNMHDYIQKAGTMKRIEHNLQTAQKVTKIMKKMTFEIRGCSRQSLAHSSVIEYEIPPPKISDELRKAILSNENVHAMGTMWGELEIHLKSNYEKSKTGVRKEIADQIKKHQFFYPYRVKSLEQEPVLFFRQGDKILSPFIRDRSKCRVGSVGCFVSCSQGVPHCLTCAHVVDPGTKAKHVVQIAQNNGGQIQTHRYGLSKPQKTVCSGCSPFPAVDIAAVEAVNDRKIRQSVNYDLRNDSGVVKPVSFLCDLSDNLVGTTVYKFGAFTALTRGVICSIDVCSDASQPCMYLMHIEDPPVPDQRLNVLEEVIYERAEHATLQISDDENMPPTQTFATEGDSGAVICSNDFSVDPKGTILAMSMLLGGGYKTKESRNPKCSAFLLARGLEMLANKGHFYTMEQH